MTCGPALRARRCHLGRDPVAPKTRESFLSFGAHAVELFADSLVVQELSRARIPGRLQFPFYGLVISMFTGHGQSIGQVPHPLIAFPGHALSPIVSEAASVGGLKLRRNF